ncbi:MAG: hypothetical protein N3J91_13575 [Verrucomicrobiae bacterium]|nr:hypothetical protein [Verrucomicrobiae bacterium]
MKPLPALCLCALLWLAGCATTPPGPPLPDAQADPVAHGLAMIERAPARDRVLWQYRTALHALRRGQYDTATRLLDEALLRVNNIFGPDRDAKKARSLFHEEAKKSFIGEPYERCMANFYRGLLYWRAGEVDNARACFRNAQFMDSDAENKTYAGDYILFDYLDGYATVKLGGDGSDAFKRAQARAPAPLPPYNPRANLLVFLEYGPGPQKYATGEYREQLRFRTFESPVVMAVLKQGSQELARVGPYDDLNFQATTRGGRVMDHVLKNKAVFKSTTDTVGNVAVIGGAVMAMHDDTSEAGLAVLGAGLVAKLLAAAANPAADTRCWDNLPLYLGFAALEMPPGRHTLTIEFWNRDHQPVSTFTKQWNVTVAPDRDTVIFVSDQSVNRMDL